MNNEKATRKIGRLKEQLDSYNVENPEKKYTYFGGESAGYLKGKINILEKVINKTLKEKEDIKNKIEKINQKIEESLKENESKKEKTYSNGEAIGYLKGQLYLLEELLDEIEFHEKEEPISPEF